MTFLAERDELGIVSELRANRAKWERYIRAVVLRRLGDAGVQKMIADVVEDAVRGEVGMRAAQRAAEIARMLDEDSKVGVKTILETVAEVTGTPVQELVGPRRARSVARPRQLAYHLLKTLRPDLSLPAIGKVVGGRDHTTIMQGLRVVQRFKGEEPFSDWFEDPRIVALFGSR